METCPIKKNLIKVARFGREGNPYWRGILLFQRKYLNAGKQARPFGRDIAAGLMKAGIRAGQDTRSRAYPRSSSNAAIS
jgi:hypothetical protein